MSQKTPQKSKYLENETLRLLEIQKALQLPVFLLLFFCSAATRVTMVTKLGRMVTYLDGILPLKSHDPLITWSSETT